MQRIYPVFNYFSPHCKFQWNLMTSSLQISATPFLGFFCIDLFVTPNRPKIPHFTIVTHYCDLSIFSCVVKGRTWLLEKLPLSSKETNIYFLNHFSLNCTSICVSQRECFSDVFNINLRIIIVLPRDLKTLS